MQLRRKRKKRTVRRENERKKNVVFRIEIRCEFFVHSSPSPSSPLPFGCVAFVICETFSRIGINCDSKYRSSAKAPILLLLLITRTYYRTVFVVRVLNSRYSIHCFLCKYTANTIHQAIFIRLKRMDMNTYTTRHNIEFGFERGWG